MYITSILQEIKKGRTSMRTLVFQYIGWTLHSPIAIHFFRYVVSPRLKYGWEKLSKIWMFQGLLPSIIILVI